MINNITCQHLCCKPLVIFGKINKNVSSKICEKQNTSYFNKPKFHEITQPT